MGLVREASVGTRRLPRKGDWRDWPAWDAYAAATWSFAYGLLGLWWTFGGAGFPFGRSHDPDASHYSALAGVTRHDGAPVITILGLLGTGAALAPGRRHLPVGVERAAIALCWMLAAALLVVPDFRVLIRIAYGPVVLAGAPFHWPPGVHLSEFFQWAVMNQVACIIGGGLFLATAVAHTRRAHGACLYCGRGDRRGGWTSPAAAACWGAWATWIAAGLPFIYAATRWAWALGIPVGVTRTFLREEARDTPHIWLAGAYLATVGAAGGILTLGLTLHWGEVWPRWTGRLAGKPVPPRVAIIPASVMTVLILEAGLMYDRLALSGTWNDEFRQGNWGTVAPEITWPLWAVALGAATLAYYYRRRGCCDHCGQQ